MLGDATRRVSKGLGYHLGRDGDKQTGQGHCGSVSGRPHSAPTGTVPIIAHVPLHKGKNRNPEIGIAVFKLPAGVQGQRQLTGACPSFVN